MARWLCLDADHDEDWLALLQLAKVLHQDDIPTYLETSRRGGHLWFFTPPLSGADIRRFGKTLLKQHGLPARIELYPKQDRLKDRPWFIGAPAAGHSSQNRQTLSLHSIEWHAPGSHYS